MKKLLFIIPLILISCGSVEQRITENSYTEEWHFENGKRYQVYQTNSHKKYIIVLNRAETKFKRKYLKR
jgi:ssDNA-binding replication factor A large subunit